MLHVDERGAGTAVVLLHGAPTDPQHMKMLGERLVKAGDWRVLAVHLPGYGRSAAIDPYAMAHSHALVEEALVARAVREVHLVGFSGGAYRAIALAARGALDVRSIVSLAGAANFDEEEKAGLARSVSLLRSGVDPRPLLTDLMLSPRGRENPRSVADVRSWMDATSPEALARELEAFIGAPDLRPMLATLDVPLLVRVGSIDQASPPERSKRIVDAARGSRVRFEEVPGVGHALLCEDFDSTLASVERHLDAARRPPR